ncbi:hypothetical protein Ddc_21903 [Ditylenchus destructor]|nr:hypothetical protein Ddc_21903 [Ditylenchus destructor]
MSYESIKVENPDHGARIPRPRRSTTAFDHGTSPHRGEGATLALVNSLTQDFYKYLFLYHATCLIPFEGFMRYFRCSKTMRIHRD